MIMWCNCEACKRNRDKLEQVYGAKIFRELDARIKADILLRERKRGLLGLYFMALCIGIVSPPWYYMLACWISLNLGMIERNQQL